MTCGAIDIACHVGNAMDAVFGPVWSFIDTWFPLGTFIAGLIIGGILGWRVVLATLTLGVSWLLYTRFQKGDEPDYETGEPAPSKPARKKR